MFFERSIGLDLRLRDKRGVTLYGDHGYALISKPALENILKEIDLPDKEFLDAGSGKGGVVISAEKLGA